MEDLRKPSCQLWVLFHIVSAVVSRCPIDSIHSSGVNIFCLKAVDPTAPKICSPCQCFPQHPTTRYGYFQCYEFPIAVQNNILWQFKVSEIGKGWKSLQFKAHVLKSEAFKQCRTRVLYRLITAVFKDRVWWSMTVAIVPWLHKPVPPASLQKEGQS